MYSLLMDSHLLSNHKTIKYGQLTLSANITLAKGRVHECAGRARRAFALMLAAKTSGAVLWISLPFRSDQINPSGIKPFVDPGRFVFIKSPRKEDLLWTMEEALRSGAVECVIVDLPYFPALTPVRRLHLAAEAGYRASASAPLGLLLTPDSGGAQGIETRWTLQPNSQNLCTAWCLSRTKSRHDPPQSWQVMQTAGKYLKFGT